MVIMARTVTLCTDMTAEINVSTV